MICSKILDQNFEYQPIRDSFINWFVTMDLICEKPSVYNGIGSYYFIGYLMGIVFFWMPDSLGRRTTMCFLLPNYIVASALVIFSESMLLRSVGFWLQGFFHLKISLSYTHALDLVPSQHKSLVTTLITALDSGTPLFACFFFKFINKHEDLAF
jgi:MFS family permease